MTYGNTNVESSINNLYERAQEKFNAEVGFGEKEFSSMLLYLGYLTIEGEKVGKALLKIPNKVMKELYTEK